MSYLTLHHVTYSTYRRQHVHARTSTQASARACPHTHAHTGISTGTAAAAVGGITTVTDMPLNSFPATTHTSLLRDKQQLAEVGFGPLVFA